MVISLEKKVRQPGTNFPPKQAVQLVQSSFANVHLMSARLGFASAVPQGGDMVMKR
jgi:hypothetical protein